MHAAGWTRRVAGHLTPHVIRAARSGRHGAHARAIGVRCRLCLPALACRRHVRRCMETTSEPDGLRAELTAHAARRADQAALAAVFIKLLDDPDAFERRRLDGHFTASAWLVDAAGHRVLLPNNRKLHRRPQLRGHADRDRDLARHPPSRTDEKY